MRAIYGKNNVNLPVIKHHIDEGWFCCLKTGRISVQMNFEQYDIAVHKDTSIFFFVHDGQLFRILECSPECELQIFSISHETLVTLSPQLGSEANRGLYSADFVTSENMSKEIHKMLALDFQQLRSMERSSRLLEQDKMRLHLLVHLYLTFYNGIGKVGNQTSRQSFDIMNRFYELFCDKEAFLHRDTKYFAQRLNITPRYLFQVCKNEAGKTPKDLINETITSEISHTILTTSLSFQQISLRFNFPDQTAFTQFFKRNTGMTPSEFKQKYK